MSEWVVKFEDGTYLSAHYTRDKVKRQREARRYISWALADGDAMNYSKARVVKIVPRLRVVSCGPVDVGSGLRVADVSPWSWLDDQVAALRRWHPCGDTDVVVATLERTAEALRDAEHIA